MQVRTYLLISGSAHSQFEYHLQSSLHDWKVTLQPFDMQSFRIAVTSNTVFGLPQELTNDEQMLLTLYGATGGFPREIVSLHKYLYLKRKSQSNPITQSDIEQWIELRVRIIDDEVKKWVKKNKKELDAWKPFLADLIQVHLQQQKVLTLAPG